MAAEYKNIVPENTKVVLKKLGNKELRGGFFYQQKELKHIHDAGFTAFVEKVEEDDKPKKRKTKKKEDEKEEEEK